MSSSCCPPPKSPTSKSPTSKSHCDSGSSGNHPHGDRCHSNAYTIDWILWGSAIGVGALYLMGFVTPFTAFAQVHWWHTLTHTAVEMVHSLWWGVLLGVFMLALLSKIPREFVMSALGTHQNSGIVRAAIAGVILDLCNHGILMVASKLYERGAGLGQVMAFLIASPWNSFSFTVLLVALIGLPWTLGFVVLSAIIAIVTGYLFDYCVKKRWLGPNLNQSDLPENFKFFEQAKIQLANIKWSRALMISMLVQGLKDSRMVLRWILFGVLLAAVIRALLPEETFATYFGATLAGLGLTILAATIIEVCSEGSIPIAGDLFSRAQAPGNSFAFLMAGVSTDYTEIMVLKSTTGQWKAALFLPLLTLPQILAIALSVNHWA